jgi:hypothetical protein
MPTAQACAGAPRRFMRPRLYTWSIQQAEVTYLTGHARADYERELRISALGNLLCSISAAPLWRRVCLLEMYREIRARSAGQRVAMELAIAESMRRPS